MTVILAIDPGPEESAALRYDSKTQEVSGATIIANDALCCSLLGLHGLADYLAIEMIACYGMPVGAETFETCVWIGRFLERWNGLHSRVYRRDVKLHLCNSVRAKDANVRQALIDRFGPGKQKAIGTTKARGPLYGIKSHLWAALGVAVTLADALELEPPQGLDCLERGR